MHPAGHPDEQLKSVLGATPHEFESRILRRSEGPHRFGGAGPLRFPSQVRSQSAAPQPQVALSVAVAMFLAMTGMDDQHGAGVVGMSAPSGIVARVRERALHERGEFPARVSEWEVAAARRELGFPLPRLLVRLYQEVANGGFGPEYLLLPLVGEGRTTVAEYGPCEYWPHGVLPILDWGCGMYAAVDCLDPDAPVLLFEPNAGPEDWAEAWFTDSPSLAQWLKSWLDSTGWWEEEVMMAEDAPEPQPWPDSTSRLAS